MARPDLCQHCTAGRTPCLRASLVHGVGSCLHRRADYDAGERAGYLAGVDANRRERIAARALQGLLAADAGQRTMSLQSYARANPQETARDAVELADALIAELDADKLRELTGSPKEEPC